MDRSAFLAAAQPAEVAATVAANAQDASAHGHQHGPAVSVRTLDHNGHEIVIRTTYEITVDGQPFAAPVDVDNSGRVHYHGLPTRDFPSTVELVQKAIDLFPDDFGSSDPAPEHDHSGHMHPPEHSHGGPGPVHEGHD